MTRILVPLIDGFEEIEAVAVIDILRRAGAEVVTAGIGKRSAKGSHEIRVDTDAVMDDVAMGDFQAIVLPGGPGSKVLGDVASLQQALKRQAAAGRLIAAICAAPAVLARHGLLDGKRATCYPSVESVLSMAHLSQDPVVTDGNIITSRGAGTAVSFALEIVKVLYGPSKAEQIAKAIIHPGLMP